MVFNVGPADEGITVRQIAEIVRDHVSPDAAIRYGEGARGVGRRRAAVLLFDRPVACDGLAAAARVRSRGAARRA